MSDSHVKSAMKAISWRIWGTLVSWLATYYVTKSIEISTEVSVLEISFKTFLFYMHERFWERALIKEKISNIISFFSFTK